MSHPARFDVTYPAALVESAAVTLPPSVTVTLAGSPGAAVSLAGITRLEVVQAEPVAAELEILMGRPGRNAEAVILPNLATYLALPVATQMDGRWYIIPKPL